MLYTETAEIEAADEHGNFIAVRLAVQDARNVRSMINVTVIQAGKSNRTFKLYGARNALHGLYGVLDSTGVKVSQRDIAAELARVFLSNA